MNQKKITFTIVLVVLLLITTVAIAQNVRPVNQDTFWWGTAAADEVHGSDQNVVAEGSESACNVARAGLLKWDLSDVDDAATVGNVTISLNNVTFYFDADDVLTLALFGAPDNWDESTAQSNLPVPPSPSDTPLATVTGPFPVGSNIVFSASGTNDPLVQYVQGEIQGDNFASFWVMFTSDCDAGGTSLVAWDSRESGTSTMELSTPTSITLATFSANDSNSMNWPMIAGLFALGAAVLVGLGYGLRRSKQS